MRPVLLAGLFLSFGPLTRLAAQDPQRALEREILAEAIEVNTSDSAGNTGVLAGKLAARLEAAGFPKADIAIVGHAPKYQNLVVRYRGRAGSKKPIMLMAHMDVVDARREDWSFAPYQFREQDGYYYGRGTSDNKAGVATLVANFIRLKREQFVPDRDLIMVLTADEETTGDAIAWLMRERRDLIDAEYALNTDGGGGALVQGRAQAFSVQTAEKIYLTFTFEVRNKGGHSSIPIRDNAIYRLAAGLGRLATFDFPVRLNETTKAFFARAAESETGQTAADMRAVAATADPAAAARLAQYSPYLNSVMRTTCVATRLYGGHADNALPQLARATVNCRILPDDTQSAVAAELARVVNDPEIVITASDPAKPSPPSPLRADVVGPIERLVKEMWPTATVVPEMSTGATDGLYVRNGGIPVYGVGAIFEEINDVRAHGRDERVGVKAFHDAATFWYRMLKALTGADRTT
ncbi:MAG: M20/M25/M40 family metallo-hydrolase [Gemmatimonadales bacterium]|nr:M20/M25/M40 family metallo-hydrolase [Gemmatimonadales bacterium]